MRSCRRTESGRSVSICPSLGAMSSFWSMNMSPFESVSTFCSRRSRRTAASSRPSCPGARARSRRPFEVEEEAREVGRPGLSAFSAVADHARRAFFVRARSGHRCSHRRRPGLDVDLLLLRRRRASAGARPASATLCVLLRLTEHELHVGRAQQRVELHRRAGCTPRSGTPRAPGRDRFARRRAPRRGS